MKGEVIWEKSIDIIDELHQDDIKEGKMYTVNHNCQGEIIIASHS